MKFQRLYIYDKIQCAMNHINMNIKSAYSITNTLVSESKKYIIPSRLGVENNNETDSLKKSAISMVKMKK